MKNIMRKLTDLRKWNDMTMAVNYDTSPASYWEQVYSNKQSSNR